MTGKLTYEELEQRVRELESVNSDCRKALEASLEREKRLRSLFDGIPVALYRTEEDGRILEANQALAEMLGFRDPQSLLCQDSARFLVRPEEQSKQRSILVREGVLHGYEVKFRRKDGSTLWVKDSSRRYHGPDDQVYYEGSLEDITKRKQLEANLVRRFMMEEAVAEISYHLLDAGSYEEISDLVLEKAKELTGSPFGFVGYVDPQTGSFVSSTFTRDIWDACRVPDKTVVFEKFTGLWGLVLNNRQPILTNNPERDHRSTGIPDGHIQIQRFLGVPALHGQELVGMIALANSRRDYTDQDIADIKRLSTIYALSIQKKHAEEELHQINALLAESKSNLEAILSAVPVGILVFNQAGQIVSDNPQARAIFGQVKMKPGSLRCGDYIGCCHRHNHPKGCWGTADCPDCEINSALANVLTGGADKTGEREKEVLRDTGGGKSLWLQFSVSSVVVQGQRCAILVLRDISRQKQMDEELKRSERLLFNSQRMGKIGGWEWDIEKETVIWTDETYRIHGFTPDEFEMGSPEHIARSVACYAREVHEVISKAFERCASTGEPYDLELPFVNSAGQAMWVRTTGRAIWEGDRIVKVHGMLMDITERKQAEEALKESKWYLESTLDGLSAHIVVLDDRGEIILTNKAYRDFAVRNGIDPGEVSEGTNYLAVCDTSSGEYSKEAAPFAEGIRKVLSGKRLRFELEYPCHSPNEDRWFVGYVTPSAGKDPRRVIVSHENITGRKQAEHELRKINTDLQSANSRAVEFAKKSEAANRAKSLFLSNMSHELRTPLNAVIGFSQLLARDPLLTERQRSDVQVVFRSGQDLLDIIDDILEISRIEAGRLVMKPDDFSIYELLADLEGMFRSRCEAKGLRLLVELDDHLPEFLYGDRTKFKQILSNLLSNAAKFTSNGGISLRAWSDVYQDEGLQQRDMVRLTVEVEDSGIGISPENQGKIFVPFEQVDSPTQKGGTGLGLAICREYATLLGGDIRVTSEPGSGSCFRFTAVMPKGKAIPGNDLTAYRKVVGLEPGTGPVRVLVVDDNADTQVLLKALLTPIGFEVCQASNGKEAIELFEEFSPHAVLMDMRMPDVDGYEATRKIKSTDKGLATPVIALTASAFERGKRKSFDAGVDAYLRKPFQHGELYELLGRCLELQYVYKDDNDWIFPAITTEEVSALPEDLRSKLLHAVEEGDMGLFTEMLDQVVESHPAFVRELRKLADAFDYGRLHALLTVKGKSNEG
jgi:PAS domain S-box-containing protein